MDNDEQGLGLSIKRQCIACGRALEIKFVYYIPVDQVTVLSTDHVTSPPWCGLQMAFRLESDRDLQRIIDEDGLQLPVGWTFQETLIQDKQIVVIFDVTGYPSTQDIEQIQAELDRIEKAKES